MSKKNNKKEMIEFQISNQMDIIAYYSHYFLLD